MEEGGSQESPEQTPGKSAPLGLPEGSVRSLIALIVVITTCAMLYLGKPQPDWWTLTFTGVIAAYYGLRNTSSK